MTYWQHHEGYPVVTFSKTLRYVNGLLVRVTIEADYQLFLPPGLDEKSELRIRHQFAERRYGVRTGSDGREDTLGDDDRLVVLRLCEIEH